MSTVQQAAVVLERVKPVIKWVGGKSRLLPQLSPLLPAGVQSMRYFEPFAGGAAMFFALRPQSAVLGDINNSLCSMYEAVRDNVDAVIDELERLAAVHSRERFYLVRSTYNKCVDVERCRRAAMFIYLNRMCFNGLHRVNKRGEFNAPAGDVNRPWAVAGPTLRRASEALRAAELCAQSFEALLTRTCANDFVYLDPPYEPANGVIGFTQYNNTPFGKAEQQRLRDVLVALDQRGTKFLLSHSDTPANRLRYADFNISTVRAARAINCKGHGRGAVNEIVVRNYN